MEAHGGRIVAKALKSRGVSHLFTLSVGHLFSIYDGCMAEGIEIIDVREPYEWQIGHILHRRQRQNRGGAIQHFIELIVMRHAAAQGSCKNNFVRPLFLRGAWSVRA